MRPEKDALEAWIVEAGDLAAGTAPVQVLATNSRLFLTVYGICRQSIKYTQAYLVTARADFALESVPMVRAAFEHAVTAQWCYLTPGGHDLVLAGVKASMLELARKFATLSGNSAWQEEIAESTVPKDHGRPSFTKMMSAVDHEDHLATMYADLSQGVHVTSGALTEFLDASDDSMALRDERQESADARYRVLHAAAMSSMFAISVLAHVRDDQHLLDILSQRSDELTLPLLLGDGTDPREQDKL